MSMSSHLRELRKKHQALAEIIEDEQRKPASDDLNIKQLKLKKLYLKEEIERLAARPEACAECPGASRAGASEAKRASPVTGPPAGSAPQIREALAALGGELPGRIEGSPRPSRPAAPGSPAR